MKPVAGDTNITLQNSVSFFSSTDDDYANAGTLGYSTLVKRKATFASASGTDSLTLEGELNLGRDLGNLDTFSSNTSVTGGSVTLVVNTPMIIKGTVAGEVSGGTAFSAVPMSLVKSGAASLTLSGANTYFGDLTVAQGALLLGNNKALGYFDDLDPYAMNSVTVSAGAVLDLAGWSPEVPVPLLISGTGAGDGALTNSGVDSDLAPVSSTYSGSLTLAAASTIGGIADITLSGSVASDYNLTKIGVNTLFFSGSSTMSGSLIVSPEGTAQIAQGGTMTFNQSGALDGNLVNNGVLRFSNSVDRTIAGAISGTGALVKLSGNNLTFANGASYTGATTISAGSLIVKGGFASAQISNSGTFNWSPTSDTTYTGTISGSGTTILTSASSVKLTLGSGSNVGAGGALQIGNNVTLSISTGVTLPGSITVLSGGKLELASGAFNVFDSSTTKLTINTGGIADLKGNTVSLGTLAMNGGSLYSSLGQAVLTFGTLAAAGTSGITASVTLPAFVAYTGTVLDGGTYQLYTGSLGTVSGGTSQILLKPLSGAGSITVDGTVTAGTSIIAASSGATLGLTVQAPVTTPLFDIQSGVNATFLSGGSFSNTGTLQIEGNVALSGKSFNFQNVALNGGSLYGGTLASGSLSATSGTLGATLGAAFGNLVKAGSGVLTISGPSTAYAGSLQVTAGTVKLGNSAALGSTGRV
ncbi:MAG: autotransporter-associated beta strand repeat-containing protein, partial [Verrucomicrobiota bacterium]